MPVLKKIRSWLSIFFILASLLIGFWVYAENTHPAELILFGFAFHAQPLGLLIIATFASGIILGLFCNVLMTSWMVFKLKRLQKKLLDFETNFENKT